MLQLISSCWLVVHTFGDRVGKNTLEALGGLEHKLSNCTHVKASNAWVEFCRRQGGVEGVGDHLLFVGHYVLAVAYVGTVTYTHQHV